MQCTECGLWELAPGDLACSWCGTGYLHFTATLDPAELPTDDYPPPIQLHIRNTSPLASITLETIQPSHTWITLLPSQPLPASIAPGTQHTVLLDVDTFATTDPEATVTVTAQYAPQPQTAVLHLRQPTPARTS